MLSKLKLEKAPSSLEDALFWLAVKIVAYSVFYYSLLFYIDSVRKGLTMMYVFHWRVMFFVICVDPQESDYHLDPQS